MKSLKDEVGYKQSLQFWIYDEQESSKNRGKYFRTYINIITGYRGWHESHTRIGKSSSRRFLIPFFGIKNLVKLEAAHGILLIPKNRINMRIRIVRRPNWRPPHFYLHASNSPNSESISEHKNGFISCLGLPMRRLIGLVGKSARPPTYR